MTDARNPRGIVFPDYCSAEVAADLGNKLESFWRRRGFVVRTWIVATDIVQKDKNKRMFQLRSDMINGLPIKKLT